MKKTLLISVMAAALSACATDGPAPAPQAAGNTEYNNLVTQAKNEIALANKAGMTWRDTEKFMKDAEEAQKAGDMDKATHGMPGKFTFCFGELEEQSPWEPYHVEHGFTREQSTVTAVGGQGTGNILAQFLEPDSILHMLADAIRCYGYNTYLRGEGSPLVVINPGHAKIFADRGWQALALGGLGRALGGAAFDGVQLD